MKSLDTRLTLLERSAAPEWVFEVFLCPGGLMPDRSPPPPPEPGEILVEVAPHQSRTNEH